MQQLRDLAGVLSGYEHKTRDGEQERLNTLAYHTQIVHSHQLVCGGAWWLVGLSLAGVLPTAGEEAVTPFLDSAALCSGGGGDGEVATSADGSVAEAVGGVATSVGSSDWGSVVVLGGG